MRKEGEKGIEIETERTRYLYIDSENKKFKWCHHYC